MKNYIKVENSINNKTKILVLVEGEVTEPRLIDKLLKIFKMENNYEVISYKTNIYTLYDEMFVHNDPENFDLQMHLRSREKDVDKKKIFDEKFSDILLIFDLEPHSDEYQKNPNKIVALANHFNDSTTYGKLYINYPMIESYYHLITIPDPDYNDITVTIEELKQKEYKKRVSEETFGKNRKYFHTDENVKVVIKQNIEKGNILINHKSIDNKTRFSDISILEYQNNLIKQERKLYVLCTSVMYFFDYNPKFIYEDV